MLQVGETLAGYRVEAMIGIGGMAVVYRARQLSLDRAVALKVLSTMLVGNRAFRERFRLEGRHAASLDHPNIIPVYEAGESNGVMFIAMRLVDGTTLAELAAGDGLTGHESLRILIAIASALDAAHSAGLTHRDVKPQNILVTRDGHPYLADFGVTKGPQPAGLTRTGDFVGSLSCVAPEQIEGKEVTTAADVYALAAVLFHCLTGTQPYQRDTDAALMHAHLHAPPPTFADIGVEAPPELDTVFRTGMAKDPADRPATAGALLAACALALRAVDPQALGRAPALPPPVAAGSERAAFEAEPEEATDGEPPNPIRAIAPAAATSADQRQPAPPPAPRPAIASKRFGPLGRRWLVVPAIAVGALFALAGYSIGHDDPQPHLSVARSAALQLDYGDGWAPSPTRVAIAGLALSDAVGLRRGGMSLAAGRLDAPKPGFDPLPERLTRRLQGSSPPHAVRWGRTPAVIHAGRLRAGGRLWIALFPDTRDWTVVACEAGNGDPAIPCRQVAATIRVPGSDPVSLGPARATADAIDAATTRLDATARSARPMLAAHAGSTRAGAARALAKGYTSAAHKLKRLDVRPQERQLVGTLVAAFAAQARVLARLSAAATRTDRGTYNAARLALKQSEHRIDTTMQGFSTAGYEVR